MRNIDVVSYCISLIVNLSKEKRLFAAFFNPFEEVLRAYLP